MLKISRYIYNRKHKPEPGLEPRASRLTHEHSITELSKPTQFCYSNLVFILTTLGSYHVCVGGGVMCRSDDHVSRGYGSGTCMYVCI